MVKNMHQLFLQVTNEGAKNTEEIFDNMLNDIDILVEGVYRDRSDRKQFHQQFVTFGIILYSLIMLIQLILGVESYIEMLDSIWMSLLVVIYWGSSAAKQQKPPPPNQSFQRVFTAKFLKYMSKRLLKLPIKHTSKTYLSKFLS
jgi:hypothetical protein